MTPTQAEMERHLEFLSDTDESYARAQAYSDGLKEQLKTIRAAEFFKSHESSATAKEMDAHRSPAYIFHLQKMEQAAMDVLVLKEKRATAELVVRCWQCLNAARTKGVIT